MARAVDGLGGAFELTAWRNMMSLFDPLNPTDAVIIGPVKPSVGLVCPNYNTLAETSVLSVRRLCPTDVVRPRILVTFVTVVMSPRPFPNPTPTG